MRNNSIYRISFYPPYMLVKGIHKRTRTTTEFVTSIYPKLLHKEKYHWKQQKYLPEEKKHRL